MEIEVFDAVRDYLIANGCSIFAKFLALGRNYGSMLNNGDVRILFAPDDNAFQIVLLALGKTEREFASSVAGRDILENHMFKNGGPEGSIINSINGRLFQISQTNLIRMALKKTATVAKIFISIIGNVITNSDQLQAIRNVTTQTVFGTLNQDSFKYMIKTGQLKGKDLLSLCETSKQISLMCDHVDREGGNIFVELIRSRWGLKVPPGKTPRQYYKDLTYGRILVRIAGSDLKHTDYLIPGIHNDYVRVDSEYSRTQREHYIFVLTIEDDGSVNVYTIEFRHIENGDKESRMYPVEKMNFDAIIPGFKAKKFFKLNKHHIIAMDKDGNTIKFNRMRIDRDFSHPITSDFFMNRFRSECIDVATVSTPLSSPLYYCCLSKTHIYIYNDISSVIGDHNTSVKIPDGHTPVGFASLGSTSERLFIVTDKNALLSYYTSTRVWDILQMNIPQTMGNVEPNRIHTTSEKIGPIENVAFNHYIFIHAEDNTLWISYDNGKTWSLFTNQKYLDVKIASPILHGVFPITLEYVDMSFKQRELTFVKRPGEVFIVRGNIKSPSYNDLNFLKLTTNYTIDRDFLILPN